MTRDKNDFPAVRTSATDGQFGKAVDPESKTGNLPKVNQSIAEALRLISEGIQHLKRAFPNRKFTIDGRLVGDIGEIIAALEMTLTCTRCLSQSTTGKHLTVGMSRSKLPSRILSRSGQFRTTISASS